MSGGIAIVDYGVGNLRSVQKAFEHLGHRAAVTGDPDQIQAAERVVLPGVGAFGAAIETLRARGLEESVLASAQSGRPFLGICVGMQLLFDVGEERGEHRGLGLVSGRVVRFPDAPGVKIPQIGWNSLEFHQKSPLFEGLDGGAMVYFVHSYYCSPGESSATSAKTEFTISYASAVSVGNLHGVQFHPEKSGAVGLRILDNFAKLSPETAPDPNNGEGTRDNFPLLGSGEKYV